ncbi:MAG: glycosyltransferase [Gemmobacter sp.]|nr:glycosyltransferase [Gemmobacter sp.]
MLSVIVPASNEEGWIGPCLDAVLASDPPGIAAEVIVVANACRDDTVAQARARSGAAAAAGWGLTVLDLAEPGKLNALNAGDRAARGGLRAYLDADVGVSPALMRQIAQALAAAPGPAYASGTPVIPRAASHMTRAYARFWQRLPFARSPAPGFGLFAMNAAGRARWGDWPTIISDDTFARLHFAPQERIGLPATYTWPMVEGLARLVRVRARQDAGVAELVARWPHLLANEGKPRLGHAALARLALADPAGFAAYAAVSLAVRLAPAGEGWVRGR